MLLNTLITTLQHQYSEIQSQIELLQESQRQIQAQLQAIGSVESKMESALALVAEAINDINHHCPDELNSYQETVNSLFSGAIAQLPETVEVDSEMVEEKTAQEIADEGISALEKEFNRLDELADSVIRNARLDEEGEGESQGEKVYEHPDLDLLTVSRSL